MGPWFFRDSGKPFQPGCSYETLVKMVDRGQITKSSVIRGPTTKQFWTVARRVPGVAHLLGYCHSCDAGVDPDDHGCYACGAPFGAYLDRNYLGLPEIRPLPWEARLDPDAVESEPGFEVETSGREAATGGLSGFASDDELIDDGGGARSPDPVVSSPPARQWARPRPVPESPVPVPAVMTTPVRSQPTVFDDSTSGAVTRALRRKLVSQQRMIRVMAVLVVMGLVIALASNLDALAKLGSQPVPAEPGSGGLAAATEDMGTAAIEELDATVVDQQSSDDGFGAPAPVPDTETLPVQSQPSAVDGGEETSAEDAILAAYAKAMELISAAARSDRSLDERIGDYKQALDSLKSLGGAVPSDAQAADLPDLIERVEEELERLRLKEFFG
jgi:hypothetical protein